MTTRTPVAIASSSSAGIKSSPNVGGHQGLLSQPSSTSTALQTQKRRSPDELTHTYYTSLLTLCSSPEVFSMTESEELIIPKEPASGLPVNLAQLKELPSAQQASGGALSKAVKTRTLPSGSVVVKEYYAQQAAAAASSTEFNPSTHIKVGAIGLFNRLCDQQLYFTFLSYFRRQSSSLLPKTTLPTPQAFHTATPSTSIFKLGKRGASLQEIDKSLAKYHTFIACSTLLMKRAKLLCFENEGTAVAASNQIGFAFPGFDSQVFDIGRFSIVSPAQMFLGMEHSFDDTEWSSALKASSVGKELMQSSADYTQLFESPLPEDQSRARTLMHQAQLEVLCNIALAAHMRKMWAIERQRLREGDVFFFQEVLEQFDSDSGSGNSTNTSTATTNKSATNSKVSSSHSSSTSTPAEPSSSTSEFSRNYQLLSQWFDTTYIYSPPRVVIQQFLKVRMEAHEKEHPDPPGVGNQSGVVGTHSNNHTEDDDVVYTHVAGSTTDHNPSGGGGTFKNLADSDDDDIILSGPGVSASGKNAPGGGDSQQVVAMSSNPLHHIPTPVASFAPTRHFLFDLFHYLIFIRLIFDTRKKSLEHLENAIHAWSAKYSTKDSTKSKDSAKYEYMKNVGAQVEEEKKKILVAINQLPSTETCEQIVKLQAKLTVEAMKAHAAAAQPQQSQAKLTPTNAASSPSPNGNGTHSSHLHPHATHNAHSAHPGHVSHVSLSLPHGNNTPEQRPSPRAQSSQLPFSHQPRIQAKPIVTTSASPPPSGAAVVLPHQLPTQQHVRVSSQPLASTLMSNSPRTFHHGPTPSLGQSPVQILTAPPGTPPAPIPIDVDDYDHHQPHSNSRGSNSSTASTPSPQPYGQPMRQQQPLFRQPTPPPAAPVQPLPGLYQQLQQQQQLLQQQQQQLLLYQQQQQQQQLQFQLYQLQLQQQYGHAPPSPFAIGPPPTTPPTPLSAGLPQGSPQSAGLVPPPPMGTPPLTPLTPRTYTPPQMQQQVHQQQLHPQQYQPTQFASAPPVHIHPQHQPQQPQQQPQQHYQHQHHQSQPHAQQYHQPQSQGPRFATPQPVPQPALAPGQPEALPFYDDDC